MRSTGVLLSSLLVCGAMAVAGPAAAASKTIRDPRHDVHPAADDITSVRFSNSAAGVSAHAVLAGTARIGAMSLIVTDDDDGNGTDVLVAEVTRDPKTGHLATHLDDDYATDIGCRVHTRWSVKHRTVSIGIPRSCLVMSRHIHSATGTHRMFLTSERDTTRAVAVRYG